MQGIWVVIMVIMEELHPFGSHCSATGGGIGRHGNAGYVRGGKGGIGSGGDINLYGGW